MTNENAVKTMSLKKKALIVLCAVVSVVVIVATSVLATVAYLTATAAVSNVFTVGNVGISMTESKVDTNGVPVPNAERVDTNTYHLVPGGKYTKDPIITVNEGSQASFLFITIKNDIASLAVEDDPENNPTIAYQLQKNGWAKFAEQKSGAVVYVYVGKDTNGNSKVALDGTLPVTAVPGDVEFVKVGQYPLFETFSIDDKHTDLTFYNAAKITINALAIQDTGLKSVRDAWNALATTYAYLTINPIDESGNPVDSLSNP